MQVLGHILQVLAKAADWPCFTRIPHPLGGIPGFGKISTAPRVKLFPKTVYARIQIDACHAV